MGGTFIVFGSLNVELLLLLLLLLFGDNDEEQCFLADEGADKFSGCSSPFFDVWCAAAAACCAAIVA